MLQRRVQFEIIPLPPFDFRLTVRKPAGWDLFTSGEVYEDETLWTGIRSRGKTRGSEDPVPRHGARGPGCWWGSTRGARSPSGRRRGCARPSPSASEQTRT